MKRIKYDTYENIFILHSFSNIRDIKLASIAGHYDRTQENLLQTNDIRIDNKETEAELMDYFTDRSRYIPQAHDLHLDRCTNSGVSECTCLEHPERHEPLQEVLL